MKPTIKASKRYAVYGVAAIASIFGATGAILNPSLAGESPKSAAAPQADGNWIRGSDDEKLAQVARHLRGFDTMMIEVGYRYAELFWAGNDRNWEFAAYQLDKIRLTTELGIERRPKRGASANDFLKATVPQLKEAIIQKDSALFEQRFAILTAQCNACHAIEKMPFVQVRPPKIRVSPVHFDSP